MAYFESAQALIGNTPIVKLTHIDLPDRGDRYFSRHLYR